MMRVAFGVRSFRVACSEWEAGRSNLPFGDVVLGEESEFTSRRYMLRIKLEPHEVDDFIVILLSEDHGVVPEVYADERSDLLWMGYNSDLAILSLQSQEIVQRRQLGSVFYDILPIVGKDRVLVIHETGLVAYDRLGAEKWEVTSDVVQTVRHAGNFVFLQNMEGDSLKISVDKGESSRVSAT